MSKNNLVKKIVHAIGFVSILAVDSPAFAVDVKNAVPEQADQPALTFLPLLLDIAPATK